jgi:oxygen-independent coproporphyrinogen-3 oxidase
VIILLGLYIHIPFCISKCKYCDFNSYKIDEISKKRYLKDLKIEMSMYKNDKEIDSIFLGGGTPSILDEDELKDIFENIYKNFNIKKDAEITVECNPGTLTLKKLTTMKEIGVNRLSIGLQATQNHHLKNIGRIHTYEDFEKNYKEALNVGFENINIDLMYALPNQSIEDFKETLEKVTKLNPSHISVYSLILEEGTKLYEMYNNGEFELMDEEDEMKLYNFLIEYLKNSGYNQYEISNYAKDNKNCNHNILYWKCGEYIGLGAGASGYLNSKRYNNVKDLNTYHNLLNEGKFPIEYEEKLNDEEKIKEKIFMGLRMNEGIKYKDFKCEFNINFEQKYKEQIEKLLNLKLIIADNNGVRLTQRGREISNSVFVEFM